LVVKKPEWGGYLCASKGKEDKQTCKNYERWGGGSERGMPRSPRRASVSGKKKQFISTRGEKVSKHSTWVLKVGGVGYKMGGGGFYFNGLGMVGKWVKLERDRKKIDTRKNISPKSTKQATKPRCGG